MVVIWADLAILAVTNGTLVATLVMAPFSSRPGNWVCVSFVVLVTFLTLRTIGIVLAMMLDGDYRQWRKLLGVPASVPFHLVFNVLTTLVGWTQDLLLFGAHTTFAPEDSLIRSRTSRPAFAYRARRAISLAWRSIRRGDVPFGAFWFGWFETPWTPNGYRGWTTGERSSPARGSEPPAEPGVRELEAAE
jgi:hypothetical protein